MDQEHKGDEWSLGRWSSSLLLKSIGLILLLTPLLGIISSLPFNIYDLIFKANVLGLILFCALNLISGLGELAYAYNYWSKNNLISYLFALSIAGVVFCGSVTAKHLINSRFGFDMSLIPNSGYVLTTLISVMILCVLGAILTTIIDSSFIKDIAIGPVASASLGVVLSGFLLLALSFDRRTDGLVGALDLNKQVKECKSFPRGVRGKYIGDQRALYLTVFGVEVMPCDDELSEYERTLLF